MSFFIKRISPFLRDIFFTGFVAIIVAICNILVIRVIAKGLGAEELGIYTLVRRTVATVLPLSSLSMGIGLARYLAFYAGKGQKIESILPAGLILSSIASLLVCLVLFPFSGLLSEIIFNKKGMESTFMLILFLLFGENLFICLYAYYRGQVKMIHANIWGVLVMGVMPLSIVLLLISKNNLNYIILGIGMLFYLSVFGLLPKLFDGIRKTSYAEFTATARKLLAYSIPRAPGGLALPLIFTVGVLASPYTGGIVNAAYISIGIWIFQILQTATDSFGQVILPKTARYLGSGNEQYLASKLRSIYDLILHVGIFAIIQLFLVLDFIIFAWLGVEYSDAVPIARIIVLSMVPFFFYSMMRNIIDAVDKKAINALNLYLSLFITVVSSLFLVRLGLGVAGLAIGLDLGLISLGTMTYLFMKNRYKVSLLSVKFYPVLIINLLMGLCIYIVKYEMMSNQFIYKNFAIIIWAQLICGILYLILLKKLNSTWIRDIEDRITYGHSEVS